MSKNQINRNHKGLMNSRLILNNTRKLDYNIINFINLKDKYNLNVKAINARVNLLN